MIRVGQTAEVGNIERQVILEKQGRKKSEMRPSNLARVRR